MRVNVDDVAFMDRRFKLLGGRLGMTWQEALGRCLPVWALAYSKRTAVLPATDIDALAEREGFAAAMIGVELGLEQDDGVYLAGVSDRIHFLLVQDAKREKALQAKLAASGISPPRKPSRGTRSDPGIHAAGASPGTLPGQGPYSPDLDLTLDRDLSRAIPLSTDTAPVPRAAPNSFDAEAARHRANGHLAEAMWASVSDLRVKHAKKLGLVDVMPFPTIVPSNHPRGFRELSQRIREEGDNAHAACDHVLAVLDKQATDEKSIEWLAEKAFLAGPWEKARNTVLKQRKPAERAPDPAPRRLTPDELAESAAIAAEASARLFGSKEPA